MKVLTATQMREVDRRTIEAGIPGLILMENAGCRVVDFLLETFAPLREHRVTVICGKGNNGGDGFVIARQLFSRRLCQSVIVVELFDPETMSGDARENRRMLEASGCPIIRTIPSDPSLSTLVIDAVLGTGLTGPAKGPALDAIQAINRRFPLARKVAVDIPSGLPSEETNPTGEFVQADYTVTFTAPKRSQCLSPTYERMGQLAVVPIGTPAALCETNPNYKLQVTHEAQIRHLFASRSKNSNKGMYGHVLVIGGSFGKSGAPAMSGFAALRSGAGLVTVAVPESEVPSVAAVRPELMTVRLEDDLSETLAKKTVVALGPGLGTKEPAVRLVKTLYEHESTPFVVDADALNALAGSLPKTDNVRVLTPHPGEMGRLTGKSVREIQADRLSAAETLAAESGATIVLKGDRTVIAFPDGETWINPTGSPAMATGGTGDILTGMIAGLIGQHPNNWKRAVIAAVWLHGRSGERAAERWGEQAMLATDLLDALPGAIDDVRNSLG